MLKRLLQFTLLALVFSVKTHAFPFSKTVKLGVLKDENGKCHSTYNKEDGSFQSVIEEGSLEARYCDQMFANSYENVFDMWIGVPAIENKEDDITFLESSEVSVNFSPLTFPPTEKEMIVSEDGYYPFSDWHGMNYEIMDFGKEGYIGIFNDTRSISSGYLEKSIDWEALKELNLKARSLWQGVIVPEMEGDSLDEKYERARKLYFEEKMPKKLKTEIDLFKKEVIVFLQSSEVQINYGLSMLKNYHPFFTQVLLEQFAQYYFNSDFESYEREKENKMKEMPILDLLSTQYVATYSYFSSYYNEEDYESSLPYFRKKVNLVLIMAGIASRDCSKLGLRPELARTIIQRASFFQSISLLRIEQTLSAIFFNNIKKCGDVTSDHEKRKGSYEEFFASFGIGVKKILNKYRTLALDKEIKILKER